MIKGWKTRARRQVLDRGKWLRVELHEVELPDGQVIPDWPWIVTPDYINVLPITESGDVLLFRQMKYALDDTVLAPVGGLIEPGEDPLAAAKRELLEETGCEAPDWTFMGKCQVDVNRGYATGHMYLAKGARRVADPTGGDLEEQEIVTLSQAEVEQRLLNGEFQALPWVAVVAMALLHLKK